MLDTGFKLSRSWTRIIGISYQQVHKMPPKIGSSGLLCVSSVLSPMLSFLKFVQDRAKDCRIGIDARMLSHEKAVLLNSKLSSRSSKLIFPPQNFIDLIWKDKPSRSKDLIALHPRQFSGKNLRGWRRSDIVSERFGDL